MKDEWLRAAMTDDKLVVELLLRLKQSDSHPSRTTKPPLTLPPLDWGLRLPRTKPMSKEREPTRRSPTTPLSWSAGGGGSGCGASPSDGFEESSSRPSDRFPAVGSKGSGINEIATTTTTTTTSKRPRRKKTFAELKEEESSLLKERSYLKKELATLHVTLKEQRSINENLKKMKIDFQVETGKKSGAMLTESETQYRTNANSTEASTLEGPPSDIPKHEMFYDASESALCPTDGNDTTQEHAFVLPDLNMMPEEDLGPENLNAAS
ncbi:hypothetical protein Ancab_023218 [Ancistrocladus abbreviatus]